MKLLKRVAKDEREAGLAPTPRQGLTQFRRDLGRAIERAWRAIEQDPWLALTGAAPWPPIDVEETDAALNLRVDVPGLEAKDVNVEVSGNQLTLRGSRGEEQTQENGTYRHERYAGEFSRTVTLPSYVNAEKVEARYDKGVLTVTIPKIPGKGPKRVSVKTE